MLKRKKVSFSKKNLHNFPVGKKAEAGTAVSEVTEVILAAVVIFLLLVLVFTLYYSVSYNKNEESAKSYFNTLKAAVESAEKGAEEEFTIWTNDIYVGYFDKVNGFTWGDPAVDAVRFSIAGNFNNLLCVCYLKQATTEKVKVPTCSMKNCISLDRDTQYYNTNINNGVAITKSWGMVTNGKVFIKKETIGEETVYTFANFRDKKVKIYGAEVRMITIPGKWCSFKLGGIDYGYEVLLKKLTMLYSNGQWGDIPDNDLTKQLKIEMGALCI